MALGVVFKSADLGKTWTQPPGYGGLIIDAQDSALVTVPVPGDGSTEILITTAAISFVIRRNGLILWRDDGTGIDFGYAAGIATLARPLRQGDTITVDIALTGGTVTPVLYEVPSGSINGSNATFGVAHTPVTSVGLSLKGKDLNLGTDYTVSGSTITCVTFVPQTGQKLVAQYGY